MAQSDAKQVLTFDTQNGDLLSSNKTALNPMKEATTASPIPATAVPIDFDSLLDRVEMYQRDVELKGTTDWLAFSGALHKYVGHERQFLAAMFSYLFGFYLESQGREIDALNAYADASPVLSRCNHPVSLTATRIISYKLNWLSHLSGSSDSSVFYYLNQFFNDKTFRDPRCADVLKMRHDGLLVGESTTLYFEAVSKYLAGDYDAAAYLIRELSAPSPKAGDPHFGHRVKLLQARLAQTRGNEDPGVIYKQLLVHPNFGNEAREYFDAKG